MHISKMIIVAILATILGPEAHAIESGFVVVRTDPLLMDTIGLGPDVCWSANCAGGVILKKDGSGAILKPTSSGLEEATKFTFDPKIFQQLAVEVSKIRHRGLPCKMLWTDGGGASIFWSSGWQRTVISFTNGCSNKDDAPVTSLYDRIAQMPEVRDALKRTRADTTSAP